MSPSASVSPMAARVIVAFWLLQASNALLIVAAIT